MPCADSCSPSIPPGPCPDPDPRPVPPRPRRLRVAAGFAAAPDRRVHRSHRRCRQRCPPARSRHAGELADRYYPHLRPSRRQRRVDLRLRLAQPHPEEAKISYPGQGKPKPAPVPAASAPAALPANGRPRLAVPPSDFANKPPIPPAMAGTVVGQPYRRRLRIDDDPFGAVGDYAGSFLVKSAVELLGGFDPIRAAPWWRRHRPSYVVAPEFLAVSDWQRHAVVADLRGSFTGYANTFPPPIDGAVSSAPVVIDRPDFIGHIDGRLDVTHDTRLLGQGGCASPPTIPAARTFRPVCSVSALRDVRRHLWHRPEFQPPAAFRRPSPSTAPTIGPRSSPTASSSSNDDRNFNQFGGLGRISYDLMPGLKPFSETRSMSGSMTWWPTATAICAIPTAERAAGTTFEFSRLLTGELRSAGRRGPMKIRGCCRCRGC